MFRSFAAGAVLLLLTAAPQARGQGSDLVWRRLISAALRAAGAQDYSKSEQLFLKAVQEAEQFGPADARLGTTFNSLGLIYRAEKKFAEAEKAYRRALTIMDTAYGDSIDVGNVNFNIGNVMFDQGHQAEAMPNIRRSVDIYERLLGDSSLQTAAALCIEGDAWRAMKRYPDAEGPLRRCADIREKDSGIDSRELADALQSLALTYMAEGKLTAAEARLRLVEKIREKTLGITDPSVAQTMEDHAAVLKSMGRDEEAVKLAAMSAAIRRGQEKGGQQKSK
jgi:tetratricopeptide (TPR) repeat protein